LRVPQSTDTTTSAYRFSMSFLAFEDPITRVTESLEEQGAGSTAQTRATALGASLQTMCGTSLSSGTYLTGIRTAGVGTDLAVIGGKFLVTNNTAPTFTVNGNIQKSFSSVNGLIDGKFQALMGATLSANLSGTPTNGSDVIINADGSLSINPKVNLRTTDGFNYTVSDGSCTSKLRPASISIQNAETWFVKNDVAISGDGRLTSPFKALLEAQNISSTGDSIYVFNGDNTTTGQNAGISLKVSQKLLGQGVALIVGGDTIVTAGLSAKIGNAAGNGVTLNTNNELRGLDITTSGVGNNGISSSGFGTLTAGNVSISSSSGPALNLTNGTLNSTFTSITSSNSSTLGINLNNISGTLSIAGGSISGSSGVAFNAQGTLGTTSYAGNISKTSAGKVVSVSGATGGNLALSGNLICTTNCTGLDVLNNTAGTITFSGSSKSFSTGTNTAINLSSNTGATINFTNGGLAIATTSATGFNAIGGGNVSTQGAGNTISSGTGTALNVANTTIVASNLNFTSISANGGTNAIVLANTGSSGGLNVTGDGTNNASGGLIQNITNAGISLTSTQNVSLTSMKIQNTAMSGINGTLVTNFSFINGTIDNSGTAGVVGVEQPYSNIAFNTNETTATNITGTLTVTGSTLTNAFSGGVDIRAAAGTLSNAIISNNTITSSTLCDGGGAPPCSAPPYRSRGQGINIVGIGSLSATFSLTKATIANNTIQNFPTGAGIQIVGSNASGDATTGGPQATFGIPNDASNLISITGNVIRGFSSTVRINTSAIIYSIGGRARGNVDISSNGTVANPLSNSVGTTILVGINGLASATVTTNNNVIVANNSLGSNGIAGGIGVTFAANNAASMTWTINNNNISAVDGNDILAVSRSGTGGTGVLRVKIQNNTVAAPLGGVRPGIRVDSGNGTSLNDTVCLNISGNSSAGSGGTNGIGLRKQGTVATTHTFGINGLSPSPTGTPTVENVINGLNPAGNGTLLISATSGFTSCVLP
jgi:Bacterial Ig domain